MKKLVLSLALVVSTVSHGFIGYKCDSAPLQKGPLTLSTRESHEMVQELYKGYAAKPFVNSGTIGKWSYHIYKSGINEYSGNASFVHDEEIHHSNQYKVEVYSCKWSPIKNEACEYECFSRSADDFD